MERVKALIDFSAMTIFILLSLLTKLELPHNPAFTATQSLNGQVIISAKESRKASLVVWYVETLKPVDEFAVLVIPMKAYNLVWHVPWFRARNTEID
jgi:hypothetical protein